MEQSSSPSFRHPRHVGVVGVVVACRQRDVSTLHKYTPSSGHTTSWNASSDGWAAFQTSSSRQRGPFVLQSPRNAPLRRASDQRRSMQIRNDSTHFRNSIPASAPAHSPATLRKKPPLNGPSFSNGRPSVRPLWPIFHLVFNMVPRPAIDH